MKTTMNKTNPETRSTPTPSTESAGNDTNHPVRYRAKFRHLFWRVTAVSYEADSKAEARYIAKMLEPGDLSAGDAVFETFDLISIKPISQREATLPFSGSLYQRRPILVLGVFLAIIVLLLLAMYIPQIP